MRAAARRCRCRRSSACRSSSSASASGSQELEPFHPDRVVSRMLGMGDVLSLIEKAEAGDRSRTPRSSSRSFGKNEFTLEDFRDQLRTIKKMGPLEQILGMMPGHGQPEGAGGNARSSDEKQIERVEAIIDSMTPDERRNHTVINGSRRKRIARGSGTSVEEVNRLLKQFVQMKKMMKAMGGMAGPGAREGGLRMMKS